MARPLIMLLMALLCTATAKGQESEAVHLDIRLMAADLVDELVFDWKKEAPFATKRTVALADITGPVGLDDRFGVLVENRLLELLRVNPDLPLELTHCAVCRRMIVKSTVQGTLITRGIDTPEVLAGLVEASPDQLALSLNFEAEGRALVLRARIFELQGAQAIVWAKTFSTSSSARRVLRDGSNLISLTEARRQQDELLRGQDPIELTTRITVRRFEFNPGSGIDGALNAAPLPFVEQAFEGVLNPDRSSRAGLILGFTSLADSMSAWSVGGRFAWLIGRKRPSLSNPDFYGLMGFQFIRMRGPGALSFSEKQLDVNRIINTQDEPKASLVAWRLGFEAHIKHRYGFMTFLEYIPQLRDSEVYGQNVVLGIPYHDLGAGVVVRW